jgi:hypothetical protein
MRRMAGMVTGVGRRGLVITIGLLVLGACSNSPADPTTTAPPATTTIPPVTTTATTAAPTTTTTPPVTTTTTNPPVRPDVLISNPNRDSIDEFDTTGDDLYRVVMELRDLFVYLEGHPTGTAEEMVALMFEPEYPYWDSILAGFRELTDNPGWHYVDPGVETLAVELLSASGDQATLRIADQRANQVVATTNGEVVRTYDGWPPRLISYTYRRGDDGRWRYADLSSSTLVSDGVLVTMVPVEWQGRTP